MGKKDGKADLKVIRKFALQNAVLHEGVAQAGAVIGKVLSENPKLKSLVKEISADVAKVVKEVNSLSVEDQEKELRNVAPELLEVGEKEMKKELPLLEGAGKGKVIMRFEPSPSGALHVGHAYVLGLNWLYCKKYGGKLILRISDTNPENICKEAYGLIEEDANWLTGNGVSKVFVQSQRLGIYYKYAEKLLKMGKAYVCECDSEKWRKLVWAKRGCECRELDSREQVRRWKKMFDGYAKGEAVVRVKTTLIDKNPAMRDFPAFRICEEAHELQGKKFRVWPLMNFAVAVDDIEMKVTHAIRAKDHQDNAMRQRYLFDFFGKKFPVTVFVGRINFEGMPVSCSVMNEDIRKGKYEGWDDIRLPTVQALKRRGYFKEAFLDYANSIGTSLTDKTVCKEEFFKLIDSFNKDYVEKSNRYFFVFSPQGVEIEGAPKMKIALDLHPDIRRGKRVFETDGRFYVSSLDMKGMRKGDVWRLMNLYNFSKMRDGKFEFHSKVLRKSLGAKLIHWLPVSKELVKVRVRMTDGGWVEGVAERKVGNVKEGEVVQFERVGFACCQGVEKGIKEFWFTQR